jgi:hypothetical protein
VQFSVVQCSVVQCSVVYCCAVDVVSFQICFTQVMTSKQLILPSLYRLTQTALTAESMVNLICRIFPNAITPLLVSQGVMVVLTVFSGGLFIPWNATPVYWVWLQELSFFTQASRAAIAHLNDNMDYRCNTDAVGVCQALGSAFYCDPKQTASTYCMVAGRNVMHTLAGNSKTDSPWVYFGYLVLIFAACRITVLILMYYPAERIGAYIRKKFTPAVRQQIIEAQDRSRFLEGESHVPSYAFYHRHLFFLFLFSCFPFFSFSCLLTLFLFFFPFLRFLFVVSPIFLLSLLHS